jgi:hypothetical protein
VLENLLEGASSTQKKMSDLDAIGSLLVARRPTKHQHQHQGQIKRGARPRGTQKKK